jgi:hypothetical protein
VLYDINVNDPVLVAYSGYNVCLRVGVEINSVPKFDIIGLVGVSFLVAGGEPLFLKIIKVCVGCKLL